MLSTTEIQTKSYLNIADTELFGPNYSGLKYDYKGLIHVYERLGDTQKLAEMHLKLSDWQLNREVVPNVRLANVRERSTY